MGTRSTAGRVSGLATASAILSAIGLGIGHLLGLVLVVVAVRRMDDSKGSIYGYRLALTACILGLIGIFWMLFGLPPLLEQSVEPRVLLLALISQVELPVFLLLFGLQDRLNAPQCEYGYRLLGPHEQRVPLDYGMAIIGSLLGAGLLVFGLLGKCSANLADSVAGGGGLLVLLSLSALLGRRGCRAMWLFVVVALALGAAVYFKQL